MKKHCWEILGIPKTNDVAIIKKAYRDLIKQHHPDKCQAPEKMRKNTIKCVEFIEAYKEAISLAAFVQPEQQGRQTTEGAETERSSTNAEWRTSQTSPNAAPPKPQQEAGPVARAFGCAIVLLITIPVLFLVLEMFGIYGGFSRGMKFVFTGYDSLPPDNIFKMVISLPLAIVLGALFHGLMSIFTFYPVVYLWGALSETKYEKYMYKIGFLFVTAANMLIVYSPTGRHFPFESKPTPYFSFLYELCRFLIWSYSPLYMFLDWLKDNWKYTRVKDRFRSYNLIVTE